MAYKIDSPSDSPRRIVWHEVSTVSDSFCMSYTQEWNEKHVLPIKQIQVILLKPPVCRNTEIGLLIPLISPGLLDKEEKSDHEHLLSKCFVLGTSYWHYIYFIQC